MLYNSTKTTAGTVMPLLMGCTPVSRIEECTDSMDSYYDPATQRTYDTRTIGTYSLKTTSTSMKGRIGSGSYNYSKTDQKNQIDDQKFVN